MKNNIVEIRIPTKSGKVVSQRINKIDMLNELHRRVRKNENGVRMYFQQAGVPLKNDESVELTDVRNLYESNYGQFSAMMEFLYPDIVALEKANAEGGETNANQGEQTKEKEKSSIDWIGTSGKIVCALGESLQEWSQSKKKDNSNELALQQAKSKAELAEQKEKSSNKTLWIVLAVVAVMLVAGVFIIKRK